MTASRVQQLHAQPFPSSSASGSPSSSALSANAQVFRPAASRGPPSAAMRARYPTPPLDENRFLEMKGERDELRKRYIREGILPDPLKPQALSEAAKLKGTGMRMCSEFECHEREFQKELDRWELRLNSPAGSGARVDPRLAVKIYRRPAAGREIPLPEEIRPPEVLKRTLDYLFNVLLPPTITSPNFALVQPFLWNRTRAVRQDFIVQGDTGALAIECHERIARLHILCLHARGGPGAEKWSEQQELEQLRKTLRSLIEFYEDRHQSMSLTSSGPSVAPNEAEFRAYNLLLHLRDPETLREVELLPTSIFTSEQVQVALRLRTCAQRSNNIERRGQPINEECTLNFYTSFFKEVDRLPVGPGYLLACLAENVFTDVRRGAIKAMCKAYIDRSPPTFDSVRQCIGLGIEYGDQDAIDLLATMGIEVFTDAAGVRRAKACRGTVVLEDKPLLYAPEFSNIIESKRGDFTNAEIVDGIAANAAPLIEVSVPPFIGWNPHIQHDTDTVRPLPARTPSQNPSALASPARAAQSLASRAALPSTLPAPQKGAVSSAFAAAPAFSARTTAPDTVTPTASAFAPSSATFSQPPVIAARPQETPIKAFPKTAAFSSGPAVSNAFALPTQSASAFGTKAAFAALPPTISGSTTFPSQGAAFGWPAVGTTTPARPFDPSTNIKPLALPKTSPPTAIVSPSTRRSSTEQSAKQTPVKADSPLQARFAPVPMSVPGPVPEEFVPAGPTAAELAMEARSQFLDNLQERLVNRLIGDLLTVQHGGADGTMTPAPASGAPPMTVTVAKAALAAEFESRIVQSWAMSRWCDRLGRVRRDKANAKRLRDLLDLASDRSLNTSSFFIGSKAHTRRLRANGANETLNGTSVFDTRMSEVSAGLSSERTSGDSSLQLTNSETLLETSRRRAQLWAAGDFFGALCTYIAQVPGSKVLESLNVKGWTAVFAAASDDPATATSEWLRQKLGISARSPGAQPGTVSARVTRKDGGKLGIVAASSGAWQSAPNSEVGLLIFELSKHVLNLDSNSPSSKVDARDIRRMVDVIKQVALDGSKLRPGLVIINWELQTSAEDLEDQVRQSLASALKIDTSQPLAVRVSVLNAGTLEDVDSSTSAFLAAVRKAVPALELHPRQRILALRRTLTLRDMAARIVKPLSSILAALEESLHKNAEDLKDSAHIESSDEATRTAFNTLVALCNYGIRCLIRFTDHIVDEADLLKDLDIPVPPATVPTAYNLALAQLQSTRFFRNEGAALLRCLLEQQQSSGDRFPWRLYFSELLLIVINRAQDTFISCRVDIDVEAEMDKASKQIDAWAHQLLVEVHQIVTVQRATRLKRSRSMIELSPAYDSPSPKKVKTPAHASSGYVKHNLSSTSSSSLSSPTAAASSNPLRALLARARQLVE